MIWGILAKADISAQYTMTPPPRHNIRANSKVLREGRLCDWFSLMSVTIVSRVRVAERFSATFECGACRSFYLSVLVCVLAADDLLSRLPSASPMAVIFSAASVRTSRNFRIWSDLLEYSDIPVLQKCAENSAPPRGVSLGFSIF